MVWEATKTLIFIYIRAVYNLPLILQKRKTNAKSREHSLYNSCMDFNQIMKSSNKSSSDMKKIIDISDESFNYNEVLETDLNQSQLDNLLSSNEYEMLLNEPSTDGSPIKDIDTIKSILTDEQYKELMNNII